MNDAAPPPTRRRFLTAVGASATVAVAGCSERVWSEAEHDAAEQVSLRVKTPPTDDDVGAVTIASHLTETLRAAGIDAVQEPVSEDELYRDVVIDRDFEVFVAQFPRFGEFDALRSLLHSEYVNEPGWQNPFSFSNGRVDDLLERQSRERGYERLATFGELFELLLEVAPYTAVAFPDTICGAHERLGIADPPRRSGEFYALLSRPTDRERDGPLRLATLERSVTDQLTPFTVDVGTVGRVLDLVYDPLIRYADDRYVPWLAESVEWDAESDPRSATVALRDEATWHDGEPLDAADVAFTFDFLADTSLGSVEGGVPATRYRARTTLVESVTVLDDRRVRLSVGDRTREVARRALTVPLLPKHVWETRTDPVGDSLLTEALTWDEPDPIGAGLYAVADVERDESVTLEPFVEHVLRERVLESAAGEGGRPREFVGVEFAIAANAGAAIESLVDGDVDLISSRLSPDDVGALEAAERATVLHGRPDAFYVVGYNLRQPELGNPRFRRAVSHLVDRDYVVEEFLGGRGRAADTHSSLAGVAHEEWDFPRRTGLPRFPGSDGEADTDRVRSLFVDAGYRYNDGELVA